VPLWRGSRTAGFTACFAAALAINRQDPRAASVPVARKEEGMGQSPKVSDHMSHDPMVFAPDMDIHRAIKALLENRISGAPVLDAEGRLVGILTKKDCLKVAFSASYHRDWGGPVSGFMTREVETIEADASIVQVAAMFLESQFRRFPVLSGGRVVGIISRHDVLRALEELW
jgi:CBS domain-containing protein